MTARTLTFIVNADPGKAPRHQRKSVLLAIYYKRLAMISPCDLHDLEQDVEAISGGSRG
jgi:hypothetical protein